MRTFDGIVKDLDDAAGGIDEVDRVNETVNSTGELFSTVGPVRGTAVAFLRAGGGGGTFALAAILWEVFAMGLFGFNLAVLAVAVTDQGAPRPVCMDVIDFLVRNACFVCCWCCWCCFCCCRCFFWFWCRCQFPATATASSFDTCTGTFSGTLGSAPSSSDMSMSFSRLLRYRVNVGVSESEESPLPEVDRS